MLVADSLHYWATEMDIDGFRVDLASIFMRDSDGSLITDDPAIIAEISGYLGLKKVRLIAEPWQGQPGAGYVLGRSFPGLAWQQWNGKFREDLRRFGRRRRFRSSANDPSLWKHGSISRLT